MSENISNHVALFIGTLAGGGAERVILNLSGEFIKHGVATDLLVTKIKGPLIEYVPPGVNVVELSKSSRAEVLYCLIKLPITAWFDVFVWLISGGAKVIRRLPALIKYLNQSRPNAVLSTLDAVNITALLAKNITNLKTKFVVRQAIFHSQQVTNGSSYIEAALSSRLVKRWYPTADKIISVSFAMTEDLISYSRIPTEKLTTIYNPVHLDKINKQKEQEVSHPWFDDGSIPVVLAVGRLNKQKNYPALLKAISRIKEHQEIRLMILGQGPEFDNLHSLLKSLGLEENVSMVGHVTNPYQYMNKADIFVLSSSWEGLPNVLLEALACGCKIVSTNCHSGPNEILDQGKFGSLVPVDDINALSSAIEAKLDEDVDKGILIARAAEFDLEKVGKEYLKWMI